MGNKYGYIRLREYDESQAELLKRMRKYVASENYRFEDKTGDGLQPLIGILAPGDHLYIDDLMSLGFTEQEICKNWDRIAIQRKTNISILSKSQGPDENPMTLDHVMLVGFVLEDVSSGLNLYRKNMQSIGILRAKREGKPFGRPKLKMPADFEQLYFEWKDGSITIEEVAKDLHVSKSTFYNWTREYCRQVSFSKATEKR